MTPTTGPHRRHALAAAALALPLLAIAAPGVQAQEFPQMNLRSAQLLPPTGFASEAKQWWADEIEQRTDGQVTVEIFWGGSLVAARDIPAAVAGGAAHMGHVPSTYDPARTRLWMTLDMPLNVRDYWCGTSSARRVALENEHLAAELERNNMVPVVGYNSGFQEFMSKTPITTLADLEGWRMRDYGGARIRMLEELGITPISMTYGEIYEAIERGVIDASSSVTIYLTEAFSHHEVVDHFLIANSGAVVAAPMAVFNSTVWEGLPENLQELILEIGHEHDMRYVQGLMETEERLLEKFETEYGMNIHYLSEEDRAVMAEAASQAHEVWLAEAEAAGVPARDVWEHFQRLQRECEAEVEARGYPWER